MNTKPIKFNNTIEHFSTYTPVQLLNTGSRTSVYLAWCASRKCYVIIKTAKEGMSERNCKKWIEREADFLKEAKHPYIIHLYEHISQPFHAIVEEYYPYSTLFSYVKSRHHHLMWYEVTSILDKLLSVIYYIHSSGYVHLDIKLKNILYDNNNFKLLDYGFIRKPGIYGRLGTRQTMSPESSRREFIDFSADIWGIGIVMFYILTGQYPYDFSNTENTHPQQDIEPKKISDLVDLPDWFCKMITAMLAFKAEDRPSAADLCDQLAVRKHIHYPIK